jgi:hypothetical protein
VNRYYLPPVLLYDVGRRAWWNARQALTGNPQWCKWSYLVPDSKAAVSEYPTGLVVKFNTDQELREMGLWK